MDNFSQLKIRQDLVAELQKNGITVPTKIQQATIPLLLNGKDVVAQGQTGTGKTFAFILPMLQRLKTDNDNIQGLIITPTRELAIQITAELNKYADLFAAKVLACFGGQDVERQIQRLKVRHIVVGTPGRLVEHIERGTINLANVNMLVLDEADQMLHMGFLPEVEEIIKKTSTRRQTMLFSATIPKHVRALSKKYMKNPEFIQIQISKKITLDEIKQIVITLDEQKKLDVLTNLIDKYRPYLAMVFCKSKEKAKELNAKLTKLGYDSDELHGELSPVKRKQVMKKFRDAKLQILVATDIAARGIDVEGVTHVFSYDVPRNPGWYIHRIGRTGRAGEEGMAITFVTPTEHLILEKIEKAIAAKIERRDLDGETVIKMKTAIKAPRTVAGKTATTRTAGRTSAARTSGRRQGTRTAGKTQGARTSGRTEGTRTAGKTQGSRSSGIAQDNKAAKGSKLKGPRKSNRSK